MGSRVKECAHGFWSAIIRTKPWHASDHMKTELNRCLTVFDLIMVGIGNTLGAGLFIITGTVVAHKTGPAIFIAFLIAGVNALLNALTYAELGSRIPKAGSAYAYTYVAGGELLAFLTGWMIVLEYVLSISGAARGWSGTLNSLTNGALYKATKEHIFKNYNPPTWLDNNPDLLAFAMVVLMGLIVASGPRVSATFNNTISIISLLVISFSIIVLFAYPPKGEFTNAEHGGFLPFSFLGVISGAGTCFFAFIGFDAVTIAAEEAENPRRDLPIAVGISVALVALIMTLASFALVWFQPWYLLNPVSAFPSALMARGILWAAIIIGIGALISIMAGLFICLFAMPRIVYAMSADGLLPSWLGYILPATKVPVVALGIFGFIAAVLACIFTLEVLADFLSIGTLLAYTMVNINLCILRYRDPREYCIDVPPVNMEPKATTSEDVIVSTTSVETVEESVQSVGALKATFQNVPLLRSLRPGHAAIVALLVVTVLAAGVASLTLLGSKFIFVQPQIWAITLLTLFLGGMAFGIAVMSMHQQNDKVDTFQMPGVPVLPAICITFNIALIVMLEPVTWIRVGVWAALGLLLYFFYGMHNSKENPAVQNEKRPLLDALEPQEKSYVEPTSH